MGEEKFASLSSGLLARKGAAKPAMRRQGYMNPQGDVADDLGWNDMGHELPHPIESNGTEIHAHEPPAIHDQLAHLSNGFAAFEVEDEATEGIEDTVEDAIDHEDINGLDGHAGLSAMAENASVADQVDEIAEHQQEPVEAAPASIAEQVEATVAEVIPMRPVTTEPADERVLARDKVAFTLRLDKERHLKLRLASALENRSAQQLVTEALDSFFKAMPDLDGLAANSRNRK